MLARLFSFPNPVNEVSARLVAGGVVLLCLATIALDLPWMTAVIAYGFLARVLTGPTLSRSGSSSRASSRRGSVSRNASSQARRSDSPRASARRSQ